MSVGLRNRQIDLIRGVAILLVLLNHFNIAYRLDDTSLAGVFGWDAVRAVARNGNYGVTIFFVVSGYLITSNAEPRWAPRAVAGDVKLLLLVTFLALSAGVAALVSRFYAEPLNRRIRLLGPTGAGTPRAAT